MKREKSLVSFRTRPPDETGTGNENLDSFKPSMYFHNTTLPPFYKMLTQILLRRFLSDGLFSIRR